MHSSHLCHSCGADLSCSSQDACSRPECTSRASHLWRLYCMHCLENIFRHLPHTLSSPNGGFVHRARLRGGSFLLSTLSRGWISQNVCFVLSSSGLFALVLCLVMEQLVLPAQILPDRGQALIAHQCL